MNYWRSLQELADTDEYRNQLENEFPSGDRRARDGITRRRFLQVMSASIAMTTLAGCRWPQEKIVPFAEPARGRDARHTACSSPPPWNWVRWPRAWWPPATTAGPSRSTATPISP